MTEIPVALAVFLSVGTVAAVGMALFLVRTRGELRGLSAQAEAARTELGHVTRHRDEMAAYVPVPEAEIRHLAAVRLPDLAMALTHPHMSVRGPADPQIAGSTLDQALGAVLDTVGDVLDKERLRADASAQAAMRGASTTIQSLLYRLQTLFQEMQERYDDPRVVQDLLAADFLNEQALRRIQATAVMCGAWPGLTRQDSHVADIVVGATSRLQGYERIQVTSQLRDPVGVVARAVEPVAVALTELMANALHHSHPDLPVAVTVQQGNRGATVIVDDAGVGMHEDELHRARRLMSGQEQMLLTELGDPVRSGFAAVGQLVRQYGFTAHVETSPYGGVRALVHIPGEPLLVLLDEEKHPQSAMTPSPVSGTPAPRQSPAPASGPAPSSDPAPGTTGTGGQTVPSRTTGPSGLTGTGAGPTGAPDTSAPTEEAPLPRRRRRQAQPQPRPRAEASAPEVPRAEPGAGDADAERSAERWGDFQRGTESGRAAADTSTARAETEGGASRADNDQEGNTPS